MRYRIVLHLHHPCKVIWLMSWQDHDPASVTGNSSVVAQRLSPYIMAWSTTANHPFTYEHIIELIALLEAARIARKQGRRVVISKMPGES
ncbi:MAG: hypothetical protein CMJ21_02050 [Phycisphaerae bacterium]|nr:hypothetical protein [Phycisphaerae bacterium]